MHVYFNWFGLPGTLVLTALLSLFALVRAVCSPSAVHWVCFAAMALSSVGDLFMTHLQKMGSRYPNSFTIGAVFFMAAHLAYSLCYGMKVFNTAGAFRWNTGTTLALCIGLAALVLMLTLSIRHHRTGSLPIILIYLVIITFNCAVIFTYAWSLHLQTLSALFAAAGVFSFLLSDLVIGLSMAGNIHRFDSLIWWLYPIGQFLLILAA